MASTAILSLLLVVCLARLPLESIAATPSASNTDLIKKACNAIGEQYDLCVSSLSSDPRSLGADLYHLTNISIEHVLMNASDTFSVISRMDKVAKDPWLKKCLDVCFEEYDSGIYSLNDAFEYMAKKNFFAVNDAVSGAYDGARSCEEVFTEPPGPKIKSPLTERNKMVKDLCIIPMAFSDLLRGGGVLD